MSYNPETPSPSLVRYENAHKSVEWLTEHERSVWSTYADVAAVVAVEAFEQTFAYINGEKYDESGELVSRYDFRTPHNGVLS